MKSWRNVAVALAAAAALGAAASAVQAQGTNPGTGYGHSHDPLAAADKRLTRLKAELKITSAQEPAWNAYAGQIKQHAGEMKALHDTMRGSAPASAPERVERKAQLAKQQQEYLERLAGLTKDLYATLTPEQKTLADQRLGGGRGHRHG